MNEGCDGGWPLFNGFFAENAYLISEECAPYQGKTKGFKCAMYETCQPIASVYESYLLGGGYGMGTEVNMMKELLRNGALAAELLVPNTFQSYKSGVLSSEFVDAMAKNSQLGDKELSEYDIEWQNVNHAVTIIGYGVEEETGIKYWKIRNSYGSTWGDHGNFKVTRGVNEFGIEAETAGFEVRLCFEDSTTSCNVVEPDF